MATTGGIVFCGFSIIGGGGCFAGEGCGCTDADTVMTEPGVCLTDAVEEDVDVDDEEEATGADID